MYMVNICENTKSFCNFICTPNSPGFVLISSGISIVICIPKSICVHTYVSISACTYVYVCLLHCPIAWPLQDTLTLPGAMIFGGLNTWPMGWADQVSLLGLISIDCPNVLSGNKSCMKASKT